MFKQIDNLDNLTYPTPIDRYLVSHQTPISQQKRVWGGGQNEEASEQLVQRSNHFLHYMSDPLEQPVVL